MKTTVIGLKDFRQNISKLAEIAQKKHTIYIVKKRNKPVFEVKPTFNENVETDDVQIDYYESLESTLSFWLDDQDDDIFVY